jgi:TATA-binding protein-associated factor Taf7
MSSAAAISAATWTDDEDDKAENMRVCRSYKEIADEDSDEEDDADEEEDEDDTAGTLRSSGSAMRKTGPKCTLPC